MMDRWKIHQHIDVKMAGEDEPIDITGVTTCHWCESREAKCIQTVCLFVFFGLCIGLSIMALLNGELYFCVMILFVGFFPIFLFVLFFIYMQIHNIEHSRRNSVKISAVGDDKHLKDILISNGKPTCDQDFGLEIQSQLQLPNSPTANDPPPEYDDAISVSESNVVRLGTRRSSLQITTV